MEEAWVAMYSVFFFREKWRMRTMVDSSTKPIRHSNRLPPGRTRSPPCSAVPSQTEAKSSGPGTLRV